MDTAEVHGEPLGEDEVRGDEARLWLARGRAVPGPGRGPRALRRGHRQAWRAAPPGMGGPARRATPASMSRWRTRSAKCSGVSFPRDGTPTSRPSNRDEKGMATRKASNQVENAVAGRIPWLLGGSADLTDSTSVRLKDVEGAAAFEPDNRTGASCTSASASTAPPRSPTGFP